jgi:hypothetical protein
MMLATPYCNIDFKDLMEYKQAYDVMFHWNTLTEFLQCVSCHLFLKVTLTVPVKYYTVKSCHFAFIFIMIQIFLLWENGCSK